MRIAIYPGSFDPATFGHIDVIQRASLIFDRLVVAAAVDTQKTHTFSIDERVAFLQEAVGNLPNVEVVKFEGLLVEFARARGAVAVVRGLRAVSDFEFEFQMALMNRRLNPELETVFLTPKEDYSYLSSRIVKEIARLGGNVRAFVPEGSARALSRHFAGCGQDKA